MADDTSINIDFGSAVSSTTFADGFIVDASNKPFASQGNIRVALQKLGVSVRHDLFQDRYLVEGLEDHGPYLDDDAIRRLWLEIERRYCFRPKKDYFWDVVIDEALRNGFHPVRDYLDSLRWDGVSRLDGWLTTYCGVEANDYTSAVGRLMLVAAVRRVRQPGIKFDEMPVFEGAQGTRKSTLLEKLAVQAEWFSDDLPLTADAKTTIERTGGRWIIEASELKGMRRGELEHLKSFLSRRIDRARMAYGRLPVEAPRQFIVVGTTNDDAYLRDPTGNRRFWPIATGEFDLEAFARDRDQLWAEASAREAEGVSIRLAKELWPTAAKEQEQRVVDDPWIGRFEEVLGDRTGKVKAEDLWTVVGVPPDRRTQAHNERLGVVMKALGWERDKLRFGGETTSWGYGKGPKPWARILIEEQGDRRESVVAVRYAAADDAPAADDPTSDDDAPF